MESNIKYYFDLNKVEYSNLNEWLKEYIDINKKRLQRFPIVLVQGESNVYRYSVDVLVNPFNQVNFRLNKDNKTIEKAYNSDKHDKDFIDLLIKLKKMIKEDEIKYKGLKKVM